MVLEGHKEAVIVEPVRIYFKKCKIFLRFPSALLREAVRCDLQDFRAALVLFSVVHALRVLSEINLIHLFPPQESLFDEFFR